MENLRKDGVILRVYNIHAMTRLFPLTWGLIQTAAAKHAKMPSYGSLHKTYLREKLESIRLRGLYLILFSIKSPIKNNQRKSWVNQHLEAQ